jgi:hypothetical protein
MFIRQNTADITGFYKTMLLAIFIVAPLKEHISKSLNWGAYIKEL